MSGFKYLRGSEWRKWDLHVHTPYSYGGNYKKFVTNLEKSSADVVGINDYCSISGYEKILNDDSIKNKVLFPCIEFRMNNIILDKNDLRAKKGIMINFHIIFNNQIELSFIRTWLNALKCFYEGGKTESLGNIKDSSDKRLKLSFDYLKVIKSLEEDNNLKDHFLVWLPYDEYGGIDNIDPINDKYFKLGLIDKAHIIGSSNKKQIDFFLWKSDKHLEAQIKSWLNNRKIPCIKGSDSHKDDYPFGKLKDENSNPINKYCWIKADPTFEGLKQIIYEPEERVYIGEEPPRKLDRSKIIKSFTVSDSNGWFVDDNPVLLNEGLISVIGGKGTGKTAVLDLIAYATKSYRIYKEGEKSFLKKAFKELAGTKIMVEWRDGIVDKEDVGDKLEMLQKDSKIRFIPQDFVDQLCSEIGKRELEEQIENVIFQKIPPENKADFTDFKSYKETQLKVMNDKKSRIAKQIEEINSKIYGHRKLIDAKDSKNEETKKIEDAIKGLDREMKKILDALEDFEDQKQILDKLNSFTEQKSKLEKTISELKTKILKIEEMENEISVFLEDSKTFTDRLKIDLQTIGITEKDIEKIKVVLYPEDLQQILDSRKKEIEGEEREGGKIGEKKVELDKLNKKIGELNSKIKIEKSKQDKIKEIHKSLSDLKKKKDSLNSDIKKIEETEKKLPDLLSNRENLFINYFKSIFEEKEILKGIYSPLENILKESAEENEKLFDFSIQSNFDIETKAREGDKLIDHSNKGRFLRNEWKALKVELENLKFYLNLENKHLSLKDETLITNFLGNVENLFLQDNKGEQYTIISQLREEYTEQDFDNWHYSTKYYNISYSIEFNGIELDNLSPGLKGVALLILFLKLDEEDRRPILIDQPEENLDNRSVYRTLMRYFRDAKKRRQVIIVTHNPNLVVNTDSEQVIVADFDRGLKKQNSRICYVSGALENTFKNDSASIVLEKQGIREHVCEILEGGKEAFEKRERKYGFKFS